MRFPTHGHNDLTSFVWLHGGQEMFVDPGRNRYTSDEISLAQVGATGHNVPTVNDLAPLCEACYLGGGWRPLPYRCRASAGTAGPGRHSFDT